MKKQEKDMIEISSNRYRLGYHISAESGWINDPNGFCYYKGYYHIFYQYHPYSADWGPMHWGHARSKDLVHWETLPIALSPDSKEDEDGCFSGSAIVKDDILYLIYTGHHYYEDNNPDHFWQNQNLAYSTDGINFTKYKKNPIIHSAPNDSTHHFRDPKVWEENGQFYMILGNQNQECLGRVITYRSEDLKEWVYLGEMAKAKSLNEEGFMWECPDFFDLNEGNTYRDILLFSPQGIKAQAEKYLNLFQTGYFIGEYNQDTNTFSHGDFKELDYGHDFYATQTTLSPDGRRIVYGWMDMWESEFPEKVDGWAGALTLPRELVLKDNRLIMQPVRELEKLRESKIYSWNQQVVEPTLICDKYKQAEINLEILGDSNFQIIFKDSESVPFMECTFNKEENKLILVRSDKLDSRFAGVNDSKQISVRIFMDTSSMEMFINNGEVVFTERFYINSDPQIWIQANQAIECQNETYKLKNQVITF